MQLPEAKPARTTPASQLCPDLPPCPGPTAALHTHTEHLASPSLGKTHGLGAGGHPCPYHSARNEARSGRLCCEGDGEQQHCLSTQGEGGMWAGPCTCYCQRQVYVQPHFGVPEDGGSLPSSLSTSPRHPAASPQPLLWPSPRGLPLPARVEPSAHSPLPGSLPR